MLLRLLAILGATADTITDCDPTSVFRPTELRLVPHPPVRGQSVLMTVKFYNSGSEITDGKVVTSITLNGLPLNPSTEPLCENTQCPLVTGANNRTATSTWPNTVSGKIISKSQWFSPTGQSLLCVQTSVRVATTGRKGLRGGKHVAEFLDSQRDALQHVFQHDAEYKGIVPYVARPDNDTCPVLSILE